MWLCHFPEVPVPLVDVAYWGKTGRHLLASESMVEIKYYYAPSPYISTSHRNLRRRRGSAASSGARAAGLFLWERGASVES